MEEDYAQAMQTTAGVISVAVITVSALTFMPPDAGVAYVSGVVGASFALIAALLGVHYGVRVVRNGEGRSRRQR